jgi:hypothetical protein
MRKHLKELGWPDDTKARVTHFMKAFKILADNRNLLDHSNIFADTEQPTALYKYDKEGNTIHTVVVLAELRQVADDMMRYFNYGLAFGNAIGPTGAVGTFLHSTWPAQPPLPQKLDYTSQPLPVPHLLLRRQARVVPNHRFISGWLPLTSPSRTCSRKT